MTRVLFSTIMAYMRSKRSSLRRITLENWRCETQFSSARCRSANRTSFLISCSFTRDSSPSNRDSSPSNRDSSPSNRDESFAMSSRMFRRIVSVRSVVSMRLSPILCAVNGAGQSNGGATRNEPISLAHMSDVCPESGHLSENRPEAGRERRSCDGRSDCTGAQGARVDAAVRVARSTKRADDLTASHHGRSVVRRDGCKAQAVALDRGRRGARRGARPRRRDVPLCRGAVVLQHGSDGVHQLPHHAPPVRWLAKGESSRRGDLRGLPSPAQLLCQVSRQGEQWLAPLEGIHAAGLRGADPDQGEEQRESLRV